MSATNSRTPSQVDGKIFYLKKFHKVLPNSRILVVCVASTSVLVLTLSFIA
jgi:hypothetical protein